MKKKGYQVLRIIFVVLTIGFVAGFVVSAQADEAVI